MDEKNIENKKPGITPIQIKEKISVECASCSKPYRLWKDKLSKHDYYVCANKSCSTSLMNQLAEKYKKELPDIYCNLKNPVTNIEGKMLGIDFYKYIDAALLQYGIYGEQKIRYRNIYYMIPRPVKILPSKRSDEEIEEFIINKIYPFIIQKALLSKKDPDVALKEFTASYNNNIKELIALVKECKYDFLDPVEYREWKRK